MKEYTREAILERFGQEALEKIMAYTEGKGWTDILVYSDPHTFEILGGIYSNHSMTIEYALELLEIEMDEWADEQGWDGWDYDALELVGVC